MSGLYLKLDSSHRLNYSTTNAGSFSIQLKQALLGRYNLCSVYIPATNFNISTTNNKIPFIENGISKVATLTPGYYATSDLLVAVAAQMTTTSGGYATYTCVQSALPMRITVTSTQLFSFSFGSVPLNSAAIILGFLPTDSTAAATSQVAPNMCNLATVRSFNIQMNSECKFSDVRGVSCAFLIPILGNTGSVSVYEPTDVFPQTICFTQPVSTLNITVSDDNGIPLNLSNEWYMVLNQM